MDIGHDAGAAATDAGAQSPTPGDDLSAIAWVQEELRRTLEAAHKALRRFLKDAEAVTGSDLDAVDPGVLRNARTQIHQGAGALELVGLPAAATVLRASETAVQRAIAKASWLTPELVGDIERSSFALLDYLQRLLAGKNVSPLALFPQYRAVQEAVEAERVHPADLWTNEWRWREIAPVPGTLPRQADATTRGDLEGQLLQLMRGSQALTAAGRMAEVCAGLAAGTDHPQVRTFWSLAAGFFEGQHHGLLPFDVFTKRVASRLLAQFRLLHNGDSDVSERLARDVLFFCAQAAPAGRGVRVPHLQAVRDAYGLVEQAPVDYSASVLGRFDPAIVAHARKRVDTATGTWHAIAGGESHRIAALGEQFALVGDSLRKLFPHGESFAAELQTAAQLTQQANAAPPPALAMEVATSLLYIAAALEDADFDHPEHATRVRRLAERLASVRQGAPQPPLETWMEELYRRVSDRQTMGSVVQELRASLGEVEKAIDTFFRSPDDRAVLVDVPVKLGAMRGVLSVLGMDAAVHAVSRMRDEIDQMAGTEVEADPLRRRGTFDRLAGNLSALGFLIDMLSVQPQLAKSLFRYEPETGTLAPVMGRSERRAEPEVAPVAPRLVEQAQLLAFASVRDDVPLDEVQRDLERLSHEAQAADQPQLAAAVLKAQEAIVQARGDDHAITTARGELSEALVDFVATSTEPAGLDILDRPAAAGTPAAPIAPIAVVSDLEHDDEMREVFLEEAREVVASARDATAQLHQQPDDVALVTTVRRAFHTLKGSSRMVGLKSFGEAAWACEQIYNTQLAEPQPASPALLAFTERTLDELEAWVDDVAAKRDGSRSEGDIKLAADRLTRRLKQGDAGADLELPIEPAAAAGAGPGSAFGALPTLPPDLPSAADLDLLAPMPAAHAPSAAAEEVSFELDLAGLEGLATGPDTVPAPALDGDGDGDGGELPEAGTALELPADSPLLEPFEPGAAGDEPRADFADSTLEGIDLDLGHGVDAPLIEPLEPTHEREHEPAGPATMPGLLDHAPQLPSAHWRTDSAPPEHIELDFGDTEPVAAAASAEVVTEAEGEPAGDAMPQPLAARAGDEPAEADADASEASPAAVLATSADDAAREPDAEPAAATPEPVAEAVAAEPVPVEDAVDDNVKVVGPLRIGIPLFNIYLNEADELSRRLSTEVAEWSLEMHRPIGETAIALAHSLAGSSATVGFADLSHLARALEHAMARSHDIGHGTEDEARLFVDAADDIRRLLHQFAAGFLKEPTPGLFARLSEHEATSARRLEAATAASELEIDRDGDDEDAVPAEPDSEPITLDFGGDPAPDEAAATAPDAAADVADAADAADAAEAEHGSTDAEAPLSAFGALAPVAGLGLAELKPLESRDGEPVKPVVARATAYGEFDDDIDAVDAVDLELFPIFEEEAQDLLPKLDAQLRDWAREPAAASAASACMRTLHTLKGGARLAGAMRLGEMAHRLETRIERLTQGDADPTTADIEGLQMRADAMAHAFDALSRKDAQAYADAVAAAVAPVAPAAPAAEPAPSPVAAPAPVAAAPSAPDAVSAAEAAAEAPGATAPADTAPTPAKGKPRKGGRPTLVPPVPAPAETAAPVAIDWSRFLGRAGAQPVARPADQAAAASQSSVRVRAPLLDRLVNQAGEVSITRSRIEAGVGQIKSSLADLTENLERLRGQLRDLELQGEVQMTSRLEAAKALSQAFDPLEFDRFTRFQELTRMMAESVNDVATVQRSLQRSIESAEDELVAQARLTRDLQDDLLRTRMVEFEGLSDRLYRVVRLAAKETGKQVRLDIVGGSIEVDRGVLDRMTGAFEHLLRNCVSHGIEAPDARVQAGKDATGTIVVALTQEGNEVGVEFRDDGAGLDLARIRDKAVSSGLIARDAKVDDAELANLIFAPGFTTVDKVTELAGRGIGMDVVRSEVVAMGGRIETATSAGQGTSFRLILPLTTAVTQVVMIRAADSTIAVPSTLVEIVRRAPAEAVASAYASGIYEEGGQSLPFYWLGALLQQPGQAAESTAKTRPVVIVRSAQQRIAVHVDDVLGNQEVVVKNLGPQLSRLPGLAGMTLLASGTVALIYNPVALATLYGEEARQSMRARMAPDRVPGAAIPFEPAPSDRLDPPQAPLILVVDDSLTVRRVTQRLLVREGYRVTLAKDGLDAIEKLAEEVPQVVLSDIEMPRMDGFDLVRNLRADPRWRELPVIMITSRIAEKHREHARELGVDHYLGKPYSEEELLSLIAAETLRVSSAV